MTVGVGMPVGAAGEIAFSGWGAAGLPPAMLQAVLARISHVPKAKVRTHLDRRLRIVRSRWAGGWAWGRQVSAARGGVDGGAPVGPVRVCLTRVEEVTVRVQGGAVVRASLGGEIGQRQMAALSAGAAPLASLSAC